MRFLLLLAGVLATTTLTAQESPSAGGLPFHWHGPVASGAWLRIYTYQGTIDVTETVMDEANIEGRETRRTDPEARFEVRQVGSDVVLCVLPDDYSCDADGIHGGRRHHRDTRGSVAVTVKVPKGVRVRATSGNGAVTVTGVTAEVQASSGNGDVVVDRSGSPVTAHSGNGEVRVTTAQGPVNASSGNGRVEVQMVRLADDSDMEFRSGNGRISVQLPADFSGYLDASTGNGRIETDFPITVQGRFSTSHFSGAIGRADGGPHLRMSSGNGDIEIRKATPGR